MAEIKTVLTDEEINARLGVIAKATPAGFHLHPIVKFINGTISTTKKGTVKFPIEIGIDQLGSPFTDLRAVASPNSNELIPLLVFVEPRAIEAAVLSADADAVDAARYRYLKNMPPIDHCLLYIAFDAEDEMELDAAIDAAIAAQSSEGAKG